jgi:antibiotic biosynthesis monooxygenase (ABM) superfamily enzyme
VSDTPTHARGPVALVFARRVKPGRQDPYRAWVEAFQQASKLVPGFLGAATMGHGERENEYLSVVRFDSFESLRAWEESELRRQWLEKLPPDTVEGDAEIRRLEGLEFWFTAAGVPTPVAPSPHKMAIVLVVVVFLLVSALTPVVRAVLGDAPQVARSAVAVVLQVGLMTYVIMPRVTRLLASWLFRR